MREIVRGRRFKSDVKRMAGSGRYAVEELLLAVESLAKDIPLSRRYRDHSLGGEWSDCRECHIGPDWLLIYRLEPGRLVLIRTGSHSDLFK